MSEIGEAIKQALERVGDLIRERAQKAAPYRTGYLHDSIHKDAVYETSGGFGITVGTNIEYARYVHEGTGEFGMFHTPIIIEPKNKKALFWPGARHPVKKVVQKGIKPNPFLIRGAAAAAGEIESVVGDLVGDAILQSIRASLENIKVEIKV
jgi:HK97 gp10 family phage protein